MEILRSTILTTQQREQKSVDLLRRLDPRGERGPKPAPHVVIDYKPDNGLDCEALVYLPSDDLPRAEIERAIPSFTEFIEWAERPGDIQSKADSMPQLPFGAMVALVEISAK